MDLISAKNNAIAKLPLLKQGDYEMWRLRIEQYIQLKDYALWEIIENDNSFIPVARTTTHADGTSTFTITGPLTTDERILKRNDVKARSILLMAIPSEHQLTFNQYKDAKTLFEAIKSRNTNEDTAHIPVSTASTLVSAASTSDNAACLSDATVYAFLANQPHGSQIVHEDLEQTHDDDLEEMDLKWQLVLLSIRAKKFYQRTRKKITINRGDTAGFDKTKVECFNCHKLGHFAWDCRNPRGQDGRGRSYDQGSKNQETTRRTVKVEEASPKAMLAVDGARFDWSFMAEEEVPTNMALMAFSDSEAHKDKTCSSTLDNNKKGLGYNVVPPLLTGLFVPPSIDLSHSSIEKFKEPEFVGYGVKVSDCEEDEIVSKVVKSVNVQQKPKQANEPRNANQSPKAVLTKSGKVPISTARQSSPRAAIPISTAKPIITAAPKSLMNVAKYRTNVFQKRHSLTSRHVHQETALKNRNLKTNSVNTVKTKRVTSIVGKKGVNAVKPSACWVWRPKIKGIDHVALKDTRIFDYGCSRHMTGNKSFLTNYQEYDGGFVAFAGSSKGGKISGKGTIRTGNLDFKDVYFVKELKFNLFSVSQMCDKKNSVLFTKTECLILSPNFKLPDENQVMLKIPRKDNMYSFDLKNIIPSKGNLVRGLPSKIFENDHTCVACLKGKQHKATCKSKLVTSISQGLQILHMDLFGPTFLKSLMGKMNFLVITDDYSRFSWVFFLAKKDETSGILRNFITGIENQLNHRVKIIKSDNGTEFKNQDFNQFCNSKGINREYSNARTPQQNGVAERNNRTLIKAARTMLADLLLPIPFWDEAVNNACYVQNRVLVTKPHNKTPYELLIGRPPIISFMRPFGYPVSILNTLDHLGKFNEKANEGVLVGYSISISAGNRANVNAGIETNSDAGQAEKEKVPDQEYILLPLLHTSSYGPSTSEEVVSLPHDDVAGKKIDQEPANKEDHTLKDDVDDMLHQEKMATKHPDDARSQFEEECDAQLCKGMRTRTSSTNNFNTVRTPLNTTSASRTSYPAGTSSEPLLMPVNGSFSIDINDYPDDPLMLELEDTAKIHSTGIFGSAYDDSPNTPIDDQSVGAEADFNNMEPSINVSPIPTTRIYSIHPKDQIIGDQKSAVQTRRMAKKMKPKKVNQALDDVSWVESMSEELLQFKLLNVWTLVDLPKGKKAINTNGSSGIRKIREGFCAFLYGTIEEEVYVHQPPGFKDPEFPNKVYKVEKALYGLHQAPRAWYEALSTYLLENRFRRGTIDKTLFIKKINNDIILVQIYVDDIIFGSTKKSLSTEFEKLMHKRFQMSSMGKLTFFLGLQVEQRKDGIFLSQDKYVYDILKKFGFTTMKTTSKPMETHKSLSSNVVEPDVDVHLYRSMIGTLIYLTSSRSDIMFAICACSRFQVTPKVSHMHAVKRIFRYLKGKPTLGLWYPKDSPMDLIAYSDSDYAGASIDRKSTTGGCQFLGSRLVSWQCKKQTIVANSTTEAEYIAASHCCGQVLWLQNQLLDYGYNFMRTKIHIDNESTISVIKNPVSHSKTKHIEIRFHFIRDSYEKKLIEMVKIHTDNNVADLLTKAFDVTRFEFLIASIGMLNP
ncbi:putative ribonuclease H-like domain-containing protein [Tanacetum coccineum]